MQTTPTQRLAFLLAYLGLLPFIACTLVLLFGASVQMDMYRPLALQALTTYAAVIVSFLGGIQWGVGVVTQEQQPQTARSLFLLSIVPSLLAWAMLFLPATIRASSWRFFCLGFVWVIDALLLLQKVIPAWFFKLRSIVTAVAIGALIVALIAA
ncbi:MAG: DUF3429 domain-containing protein [Gammaproteobacteria bacterium]|nr:DUF3429 domain-containing protein [Gammaproteobacteria bacterium]